MAYFSDKHGVSETSVFQPVSDTHLARKPTRFELISHQGIPEMKALKTLEGHSMEYACVVARGRLAASSLSFERRRQMFVDLRNVHFVILSPVNFADLRTNHELYIGTITSWKAS
jgi:hypothetical protein